MYISHKNPKIEKVEIINPIKFKLLVDAIKISSLFNMIKRPKNKIKIQINKQILFYTSVIMKSFFLYN